VNEQLAIDLFNIGAIRFDGPFRFKIHERHPDFPLSPNKVDLRTPDNGGNLTSELAVAIAWEMWKKAIIARARFDLVVGLPKAGEPFAKIVAQCAHKPLPLKMRKEELPSGQRCIGKIISGNYHPGQNVLVLDDVFSQGSTKVEGAARIEDAGLRVAAIIAAVDREEGGSEYLQELGYRILWIYELSWLFKFYCRIGKISQRQMEESLAYSQLAKKIFLQNLT